MLHTYNAYNPTSLGDWGYRIASLGNSETHLKKKKNQARDNFKDCHKAGKLYLSLSPDYYFLH